MNIIVTGSNGFLGLHLSRRLRSEGYQVYGFDLDQGDITLPGVLDEFEGQHIDHVFHLAGKTFVPESWQQPALFYQINVQGTNTVLDFCRKTGSSLTFVSSYLYGHPKYLPIDENHPLQPYNPYSHSKLIAEQLVTYYTETFHLNTTIFRPFNAYGPHQSSQFIIPEVISKVLDPTLPEVRVNDFRPRRDYIFVEDITDAFIASVSGPRGIFNLGSGYSISVKDIIETVFSLTGIEKPCIERKTERPQEVFDLFADISRARQVLGWNPKTSHKEGIRQCIESMKDDFLPSERG